MKPFSRNLPKCGSYPDTSRALQAIGFFVLAGICYLVFRSFQEWGSDATIPYLFAAGILAILIWPSHYFTERKLKAIITERPEESICTFARSFDRRKVDPWVVRAVYNDL